MKRFVAVTFTLLAICMPIAADSSDSDPGRIDVYVTPYYNSSGPVVDVGKFSAGLASKNRSEFVTTIQAMKKQWTALGFPQLYVAAIRLYDLGYRNEAVYWFYSAQYRGRQFGMLLDQAKMGSMGDPGFELFHAQDAFFQLVGTNVNGYAFGDIDSLVRTIRRVQNENRTVPNMQALYPGVTFKSKSEWAGQNAQLNEGLGKLATTLVAQKDQIRQERVSNGTQARFSSLASSQFPGGL